MTVLLQRSQTLSWILLDGKGKERERRRKGEVKGVEGGRKGRKRKGKGEMVPHFLVQIDANVSQRYT